MTKAFLRAFGSILLNCLVWAMSFVAVWFLLARFVEPSSPQPEPVPSVVIIEGCQYFKIPSAYGYDTLVHKGNCTNH